MLAGKKILIGITGSIAAYKIILLTRLLVKANAEVKIVMTASAQQFVSPLVLSTLSKSEVLIDLSNNNNWANHVALGRWADIMLITPLSCNTLAKMANGICDNLLMAVYLSATCHVAVAPAMDEDMWHHPSTKRNIETIKSFGNKIINVEKGELASGLFGDGRMAEPEAIFTYVIENFFRAKTLNNKTVVITAGPTREAIDPVRYITNHSTGKMGIALAESLYMHGADVHLICGPVNIQPKYKGINVTNIESAKQMFEATEKHFANADILIMSAAVADYAATVIADKKIKKKEDEWALALTKTTDILAALGKQKTKQFIVGFALETNNVKENAMQKLKNKNADCIVLNSLTDENAGFGYDTNKITILGKDGEERNFELKSKNQVAEDIAQYIIEKNV
ncbi:MAG: bifunctional phosphopantothenoylcysteine decarboxylase/phosphopantothenate--cysteine ligase CoaBC [Chitinophaga sp.]|jgi:phosphopantothenoylcysteine decarboxylase/phosphopantothenate--cysteine ligase|nr:bifunctional phosphopantothenoylcysteine decarboxylase/phosphopantothenate--cysteine ligase CoaBC [Chitinophaga sp.]